MKPLLTLIIGFALALTSFGNPAKDTPTAEQLLTRSYEIVADVFVRNLKQLTPPKSGEPNQELLLRFLKENHVEIQKPTVVILDPKRDRLHVRATQGDQDKIQTLVEKITRAH